MMMNSSNIATSKRRLDASSSSPPPSKRVRHIASSFHRRQTSCLDDDDDENDSTHQQEETSPQEYLMTTLGCQSKLAASLDYSPPTKEQVNGYTHDVITAIQTENVEKLRHFHSQGRILSCCNRYGESLLHMACRRGFSVVVKFLVEEAKVPIRICDDYGRTPLHDAFWTCEPNLEIAEFLITKCPSLLFVKDKRQHYPLEYARREHWSVYIEFLKEKRHLFHSNHDDEESMRVVG